MAHVTSESESEQTCSRVQTSYQCVQRGMTCPLDRRLEEINWNVVNEEKWMTMLCVVVYSYFVQQMGPAPGNCLPANWLLIFRIQIILITCKKNLYLIQYTDIVANNYE